MNIDLKKLEKTHWFEDENGNEIASEEVDRLIRPGNKAIFYRHSFPLEIHDYIDEYCYHPKNPIIKFLCRKSQRFYNWISVGKERTFKTILDGRTTYGSGQDCIVAMVNSGDFTLKQAILVYTNRPMTLMWCVRNWTRQVIITKPKNREKNMFRW